MWRLGRLYPHLIYKEWFHCKHCKHSPTTTHFHFFSRHFLWTASFLCVKTVQRKMDSLHNPHCTGLFKACFYLWPTYFRRMKQRKIKIWPSPLYSALFAQIQFVPSPKHSHFGWYWEKTSEKPKDTFAAFFPHSDESIFIEMKEKN